MKLTRLEKVYIVLLAIIFGGIVVHAPFSVYLGTLLPKYSLIFKSWKEILMVVAFGMMLYIATRRHLWKVLWRNWLLRLILAFALLHILLVFVLYQGLSATAAGLAIDLRFVLYFVLVYVAMVIAPEYRKRIVQVGIAGAVIVAGFAALQLFLPKDILTHIGYSKSTIQPYLTVDKNPQFIRENSTLRGPNPLGAYGGIVLAFIVAAWIKKRDVFKSLLVSCGMAILAVCSLISVWVSYSRSALVAAGLAIAAILLVVYARKLTLKVWIAIGAVIIIISAGLFAIKGSLFVSNVLLHENPNGGSKVSSNANHLTSLQTGWRQALAQPFGAGVGSTGSASLFGGAPEVIENQYLFVAHESGWLGLGLFMAIFVVLLVQLWHRRDDWLALGAFASGLGLAFIGLLLPVWVDDTVSIVWWGVAALALGGSYARHKAK